MKRKQEEITEDWSLREKLALAHAVRQAGESNWSEVSRLLAAYYGVDYPPDRVSERSCAMQYDVLMQTFQIHKRQRGENVGRESALHALCTFLRDDRIKELTEIRDAKRALFLRMTEVKRRLEAGKFTWKEAEQLAKEFHFPLPPRKKKEPSSAASTSTAPAPVLTEILVIPPPATEQPVVTTSSLYPATLLPLVTTDIMTTALPGPICTPGHAAMITSSPSQVSPTLVKILDIPDEDNVQLVEEPKEEEPPEVEAEETVPADSAETEEIPSEEAEVNGTEPDIIEVTAEEVTVPALDDVVEVIDVPSSAVVVEEDEIVEVSADGTVITRGADDTEEDDMEDDEQDDDDVIIPKQTAYRSQSPIEEITIIDEPDEATPEVESVIEVSANPPLRPKKYSPMAEAEETEETERKLTMEKMLAATKMAARGADVQDKESGSKTERALSRRRSRSRSRRRRYGRSTSELLPEVMVVKEEDVSEAEVNPASETESSLQSVVQVEDEASPLPPPAVKLRGRRGRRPKREPEDEDLSVSESAADSSEPEVISTLEKLDKDDVIPGYLSRASAINLSEPSSPASFLSGEDPDSIREFKQFKKSILLLWQTLASNKYANLFLHPVKEEEAPGYHTVVHRPMDLQKIKRNIELGVIRTAVDFERDVLLMFRNAVMYNNSSHDVYRMSVVMEEECLEAMQDFMIAQITAQSNATPKSQPNRRETREHRLARSVESPASPLADLSPHHNLKIVKIEEPDPVIDNIEAAERMKSEKANLEGVDSGSTTRGAIKTGTLQLKLKTERTGVKSSRSPRTPDTDFRRTRTSSAGIPETPTGDKMKKRRI